MRRLLGRPDRPDPPRRPTPPPRAGAARGRRRRGSTGTGPWVQHDEPSFTIDVLPVDAFAALERVAAAIGEILADDPPYLLEVLLREPGRAGAGSSCCPRRGPRR